MPKKINIVGKRFGRLTVLEECNEHYNNGVIKYKCQCDCGNIYYARSGSLRSGSTKSCGCLKPGKSNTRLYNIYASMKKRCYNKNDIAHYKRWGGRGIVVCSEWLNDFMTFYNWAISNGYREGLTIDRIDNNKGYSPDNCRWVTNKVQANNRRSNVHLTYNGRTQTIAQWSEELGINYKCLWKRHKLGWPDKECLFGRSVK